MAENEKDNKPEGEKGENEPKNEPKSEGKEFKRRASLAFKANLLRQKVREIMGKVGDSEKSEFPELKLELQAADIFHEHLKKIKKAFSRISKALEGNRYSTASLLSSANLNDDNHLALSNCVVSERLICTCCFLDTTDNETRFAEAFVQCAVFGEKDLQNPTLCM
jgi:hypothetical protein